MAENIGSKLVTLRERAGMSKEMQAERVADPQSTMSRAAGSCKVGGTWAMRCASPLPRNGMRPSVVIPARWSSVVISGHHRRTHLLDGQAFGRILAE